MGLLLVYKDEIIKVEHAFKLFEAIKHDSKVMINPPNMTHNVFNLDMDFVFPLKRFVRTIDEQDRQLKEEKMGVKDHKFEIFGSKIGEIPNLKPNTLSMVNKDKEMPVLDKLKTFKKRI